MRQKPGSKGAEHMIYRINPDVCIGCGSCAEECLQEAITVGDDVAVIDEDSCIGCASCLDACPLDAIEEI